VRTDKSRCLTRPSESHPEDAFQQATMSQSRVSKRPGRTEVDHTRWHRTWVFCSNNAAFSVPSCASNATDEAVNLQLRTVHTCQESTSSNEKSPIFLPKRRIFLYCAYGKWERAQVREPRSVRMWSSAVQQIAVRCSELQCVSTTRGWSGPRVNGAGMVWLDWVQLRPVMGQLGLISV